MNSEMPYFLVWSLSSSAWCIMRYTVCPCLVSCPFYNIIIAIIIPFLIYESFHLFVIIIIMCIHAVIPMHEIVCMQSTLRIWLYNNYYDVYLFHYTVLPEHSSTSC